ncbi:MAG: hypothetical protein COW00_20310 [Bdellovibrio sp. CG12_big_fil_rev_8_21_14_0_65_39_13]|nr:MAG: hypothetical protein COW78_15520 [Bdellovibrio sp. CG22_combo_CG10-13_8_21_14_all_39_27]PIQ57574.1 MAG: hypothetical protein COW00_20310 [Bdellovibrio sp. CG12_big_fil_rev_8_21_14_0_65_39_13]PIR33777.1 MAG: hypothetical protein COV37_15400 [Bdellovibrio sp. CG11_big_fil_rev_8_21_14_0_20_39_38]PJB53664.1 MAG: hypothetical protein CO099_05910 [Bdellovibrio sp. CG_4_9_14_3_um_filter_39_7]
MKIYQILFLSIVLMTLHSCKQEKKADEAPSTPRYTSWDQAIQGIGDITGDQKEVGEQICRSLQDKRYFLSRQVDQSLLFNFVVNKKECVETKAKSYNAFTRLRVTRNGELSFEENSRSRMLNDVLTDITPNLKDVCAKLLNGETPSNTFGDDRTKTQITFQNANGKAIVQIAQFEKRGNLFFPYLIDRAQILRDSDTRDSRYIGMAIERAFNQRCLNGQTYYISQVLK